MDQINKSKAEGSLTTERDQDHHLKSQGPGEIFLEHIKQAKRRQEDFAEESRRWQADLIDAIHQGSGGQQEFTVDSTRPAAEREDRLKNRLLESLHFSELRDRHDRIAEAHQRTFQWIYGKPHSGERSWTHFVQWLEGDGSLYWITGKAGSGKSTLMKYLFNNGRTMDHLKIWASGKHLVVVAFFFWNSGTDIQSSQDGLLRSLLFQVLVKSTKLIPRLFPERWEVYSLFSDDISPWSRQELRKAFRLLAHDGALDTKYCLLIDGLDEFDGEHSNLIDFLKDIVTSTHLKICVSSRPWVVFEDAFNHQPNLMLQDLTYPDITNFINSAFSNHAGFTELKMREPQYASDLLEAIAQKAAGVFLWVHLVVQSLLAGLLNSDRVSDLQRRLDSLPPDLENLYEKILKSLDPFYFQHAAQYFQIIRRSAEPPSLLSLSFADDEPGYVQRINIHPLNSHDKMLRAHMMRRRINSRCKGLLEVASDDSSPRSRAFSSNSFLPFTPRIEADWSASRTVQYLHRTVKDYVESSNVWKDIVAATQDDYSPSLALCMSSLAQLKTISPEVLSKKVFCDIVEECLCHAYDAQEDQSVIMRPSFLIILLDELDSTAKVLLETSHNKGLTLREKFGLYSWSSQGRPIHWIYTLFTGRNFRNSLDARQTFLPVAVKLDLHLYVSAKVREGCLVKEDHGFLALMVDAIIPDQLFTGYFSWCPFPSPRMVQCVLENGPDPNWRLIRELAEWTNLLDHLSVAISDREFYDWIEVATLLLRNGADPSMDMPFLSKLASLARDRGLLDKTKELPNKKQKPFWYQRLIGLTSRRLFIKRDVDRVLEFLHSLSLSRPPQAPRLQRALHYRLNRTIDPPFELPASENLPRGLPAFSNRTEVPLMYLLDSGIDELLAPFDSFVHELPA